jgi:L-iditol 2-dehydrogenase
LKAAIVNGAGKLEVADVQVPHISSKEILVKMRVCGVCGTDVEKLHGVRVTPPVLGHEAAGEIDQIGAEVHAFSKGDRVIVHHHVPCYSCFYCQRGDHTMCADFPKSNLDPCGFAEYFRVPETNVSKGAVFKIPSNMSYEEAAFAEPTGCCIRGLNKLAVDPQDSVLVIGAGPAGLTHIVLLRSAQIRQVLATDVVETRLKTAVEFGANEAFDAAGEGSDKAILDATEGRGPDKVIVASGSNKAIESSLRLVRKGGRILLFGIPPGGIRLSWDPSYIFIREICLTPSYSTTETEIKTAIEMMAARRIKLTKMITHRFGLHEIEKAFRAAEDCRASLKVMVQV